MDSQMRLEDNSNWWSIFEFAIGREELDEDDNEESSLTKERE